MSSINDQLDKIRSRKKRELEREFAQDCERLLASLRRSGGSAAVGEFLPVTATGTYPADALMAHDRVIDLVRVCRDLGLIVVTGRSAENDLYTLSADDEIALTAAGYKRRAGRSKTPPPKTTVRIVVKRDAAFNVCVEYRNRRSALSARQRGLLLEMLAVTNNNTVSVGEFQNRYGESTTPSNLKQVAHRLRNDLEKKLGLGRDLVNNAITIKEGGKSVTLDPHYLQVKYDTQEPMRERNISTSYDESDERRD